MDFFFSSFYTFLEIPSETNVNDDTDHTPEKLNFTHFKSYTVSKLKTFLGSALSESGFFIATLPVLVSTSTTLKQNVSQNITERSLR